MREKAREREKEKKRPRPSKRRADEERERDKLSKQFKPLPDVHGHHLWTSMNIIPIPIPQDTIEGKNTMVESMTSKTVCCFCDIGIERICRHDKKWTCGGPDQEWLGWLFLSKFFFSD
jgi:hypothetical protein